MKSGSRNSNFFPALFPAVGMLIFTFLTMGWFSDRGVVVGFEFPLGTKDGALSTLSDLFWMLSPFLLLIAILLSEYSKSAKRLAPILAGVPLFCYAFLESLFLFSEENISFPQIFTLVFLLLLGAFSFVSSFVPEGKSITAFLAMAHILLQIFLLILSFLFGQKYSWFYFSETIYFGRYDAFRYSFVVISVLFYYLFYSLSLFFFFLPSKKAAIPPEEKKILSTLPEENQEEEEADLSSLSLEDFGIEK